MKSKILKFIKKYLIEIIIFLITIITISICVYSYFKPTKITHDFSNLDLDGYDKLMIVAHPDDELLWGGIHLLDDDYLVVCITCGVDNLRVKEFESVMAETNDKYIMLGYPDKTNGERDNWDTVYNKISKDIASIIALKDWELIVTHNPQGEYGHIHHKMTSKIVTSNVSDKTKLYYFGRYHSKKTMAAYLEEMAPANEQLLKKKKELIGYYRTQVFIQTAFDHMYEYEDWEPYSNWEGTIEE